MSPDPTIQHPYDPQDFNRYTYARNNPVKYIDPSGYGWLDWLWSFIAGVVGAIVTVVVSAVAGPIVGGAVGGAVSGAILGAVEGGLSGALKGAAWGAAIGGVLGAGFQAFDTVGLGGAFLATAAVGGAAYAGITEGGEGLANYAAGMLGAAYGSAMGNALLPKSTVTNAQTETQTALPEGEQVAIKQRLNAGQLENPTGTAKSNAPSSVKNIAKANIVSDSAAKGQIGNGNNPTPQSNPQPSKWGNLWRGIKRAYATAEIWVEKAIHAPVHALNYVLEAYGPMDPFPQLTKSPLVEGLAKAIGIPHFDRFLEFNIEGWENYRDSLIIRGN